MIKHTRWEIERRSFLKALGVGVGMIPMLTETRALAAPAMRGRFLVFAKPNGTNADSFWPQFPNGRPGDGALDDAKFPYSSSPLAPFRKRLIFPDGLAIRAWLKSEGNPTGDNGDAHHSWGSTLTGRLPGGQKLTAGGCQQNSGGCLMQSTGPSLDCYLAQRWNKLDPSLPEASMHVGLLGSNAANGYASVSWKGPAVVNGRERDPVRVFDALFAGKTGTPVAAGPEAEKARRERLRVLDFTFKDIERFRKRLGSEDRALLENHLQSVSARRKQIEALGAPSSGGSSCKTTAPGTVATAEANTGAVSKVMLDLVFDAMRCNVARSFAFTFFDSNAYDTFFTWLKDRRPEFGQKGLKVSEFPEPHYHSLAHGGGRDLGKALYDEANKWQLEQMAYLLKKLEETPEGAGSMLDSTLVLWTDMFSSGGGHNVFRVPWVLAGNVDGYFRTGRHVVTAKDVAVNGLFVSIANALGLPPPDNVFGDAKFGRGELATLKA